MTDAQRLLNELRRRAKTRTRVDIDDVWLAFRKAIRGYTGKIDARPRLAQLLGDLADAEHVELPRGSRLWDRSAQPPLPAWVRVIQAEAREDDRVDHRAIAWPPELAFVSSLQRTPLLRELLAIRRFLAEGGRERPHVALRERSLEVFGDEKRLDALVGTSLFGAGRLSLDLLRCYDVAPPMVWEPGPPRAEHMPILAIENLHTYDSFRRWNADSGDYAAIAYGHGHEFKATCRDLPRVCEQLGTRIVEYFGDLDARGLEIPIHAAKVLGDIAPDLQLVPAGRWYSALLDRVDRAVPDRKPAAEADALVAWLPNELRSAACELLASKRRLPQELIGVDVLAALRDRGSSAV
jgi:hypothetical protein